MKRGIWLLLALTLISAYGRAADDLSLPSDILFDDACDENGDECAFWSCYETGKCNEKDLEDYRENKVQKEAVRRDESPRQESGEMLKVMDDCAMYFSPKPHSEPVGAPLKAGKRVWTVPSVAGWVKVFRRSGPAYVRSSCFK